ncbi:hypothetical protein BU17DRAFT_70597 [Hysterangium stoloniferum]|nr:hypothetical protein BU17DRAFT_70597 [Hysterangium stoloniferum]
MGGSSSLTSPPIPYHICYSDGSSGSGVSNHRKKLYLEETYHALKTVVLPPCLILLLLMVMVWWWAALVLASEEDIVLKRAKEDNDDAGTEESSEAVSVAFWDGGRLMEQKMQ